MKIALDFDQTYTVDPKAWDDFVLLFRKRGHEVRFVTYRPDYANLNSDIEFAAAKLGVKIHYTAGEQKSTHCINAGWKPDIWIDDMPELIPSIKMMKSFSIGCAEE